MTAFMDADLPEMARSALQLGLSVLIQSSLLIVVGLLSARVLRRRGPALQSAIYRATLASVALTVVLSICSPGSFTPLWRIALPPAPETALGWSAGKAPEPPLRLARANPTKDASRGSAPMPRMKLSYPPPSHPLPEPATRPGRTERTAHLQRAGTRAGLYVAAVGLWGAVAGMLLAWLALCYFYVLRLRARSAPVREGDAAETLRELCAAHSMRSPVLLAGSSVRSPFLTGLWRPAILLPASYAADFDEEAMRAILAHELMHLTRRDCAWNLLGRLTCSGAWMQPLLWVLCRRMEQASEEVCDQAVIQHHCPPRAYATCLLDLAERFLPRPPERALGSGVVPDRSSLARRIQQILAGPRARVLELSRRTRGALAAGVLMAVIGGSFLISGAVERPVGAAPEELGARGPVSGQVLTPDGQPVKGAKVFWVSRGYHETRVRDSVTTDDSGRFRFADADRLRTIGENPQLVVLADGWGLTCHDLPRDSSALAVTAVRSAALRVPFLDPEGKPAVNLSIRVEALFLQGGSSLIVPVELADAFAARTDGEGVAMIPGLPQGCRPIVAPEDVRYAKRGDSSIELTDSPVTHAESIHLMPGASIEGRVTYEDSGKPATGMLVGAQGLSFSGGGWGESLTDANGRYQLRQLCPGGYNVALDIRGELASSWTARAHERLIIGRGEQRSGIDFTLIHGALITGRVVAADTGEPVPGVGFSVQGPAHPPSGAWTAGAMTGPDGRYVIHVPAGKQHLGLANPVPPGFHLPVQAGRELTVADGETVTIDVRLSRERKASPVRGQVLGPDGEPVAGAEVEVVSSDSFRAAATPRRTDAAGAFTLEADLVAKPVLLRARRGTMATVDATPAVGGDTVTLRLKENVPGTLTGRVLDAAGRPIAGAKASLAEWVYDSGTGRGQVVTDAQGRYTFAALWPNSRYSVHAEADGYGYAWTQLDELRPGQTAEVAPLVLETADQSVAGRVVDAKGAPVAGATVYLEGHSTRQQSQTTDQKGRFRFKGAVAETVELQCNIGNRGQFDRQKVPAGSMNVLLVLPPDTEMARVPLGGDEMAARFAVLDGKPAPALQTGSWVNGTSRTLPQLRGKVVLIDFWGMNCGPCMAALPAVQRTAERFASRGVVVIGLTGSGLPAAELKAFAQQRKLTYPMAVDAPDDSREPGSGKTFRAYGIQGIPAVAVIDQEGKVAYLGNSLAEAVGTLGRLVGR